MHLVAFASSSLTVAATSATTTPVDFAHDVLPILKQSCVECHSNGKYKGGVSMDTRKALLDSDVVGPGKSEESELILRVQDPDPEWRMPPEGDPLTATDIDVLRAWIDQGMNWQEGFSFKADTYVAPLALREVPLPPAQSGRDHPIDRIVDAYFAERGAEAPPPLSDTAFFRRVSLDLIGTLPDPEDVSTFAADPDPRKREALVDRLLKDREAYAAHWLTFWNDLLRNDYVGTGYIDGGRKPISGWLYSSLFENKSYDRFVRELIHPTPESEGFIRGIKWRGRVNASQVPALQFAQNVSQVFLGINMKCASCHDSFIDDWTLRDAYGLAAIVAEQPLEMYRCDVPTGQSAEAAFPFPELGAIDSALSRDQRLTRLADLMVDAGNGRTARTLVNRIWDRMMGRGIVFPVDSMGSRPWNEDLLDYLAKDFVDHGYDLKRTVALIATSQAYQSRPVSSAEPAGADDAFMGPLPRRMTAEQFVDALWRLTGTGPEKPHPSLASTLQAHLPEGPTKVRASLVPSDPLMRSLGRPNREQVVSTRPGELTTLQALELSNGDALAELIKRGANALFEKGATQTATEWIDGLFQSALSRRPGEQEQAVCRDLLGSEPTAEGLEDLLWALVLLPEFQTIR